MRNKKAKALRRIAKRITPWLAYNPITYTTHFMINPAGKKVPFPLVDPITISMCGRKKYKELKGK